MAVVQSSAKATTRKSGNVISAAMLPAVSRPLRPKQVRAATSLVSGQQGKDVAAMLGVAPETLSRERRPEFKALVHELLQDTIDSARLGLVSVSLCAESVEHLKCLIRSLHDQTSLAAIALVLSKAGPMLHAIDAQRQGT